MQALDRWRLTSPHRELLEAVAAIYGGEVQEWHDAMANPPHQFELYTGTPTLRIVMPASLQFEQFLEA